LEEERPRLAMLVTLPRGVAPCIGLGKMGLSGTGVAFGFGVSELLRRPADDVAALADDRRRGVPGESTLGVKRNVLNG
jgi:hypothetical protein